MTTSDKRPRRTTKSKSAKTSDSANTSDSPTTPDTPEISQAAKTSGGAKTPGIAADAGIAQVENAAAAVRGAKTGARAQAAAATRPLKAISISVTAHHREDRHASIALAAYFRSESRGFAPGHDIEDWLAAEEEVDQRLLGEGRTS
jgi:Protein of unknown function (DUF2934)